MDDIADYLKFFIWVVILIYFFKMHYNADQVDSNISLDILKDKKHPEHEIHIKRAKDGEIELLQKCRTAMKHGGYESDDFKNSSCMKLCKLYNN